MRRFLLCVGLGTALIGTACARMRPRTPLGNAAVDNDADAVRRLLAEGAPADGREPDGVTPLMWAARADAIDTMVLLLDAGADTGLRDSRNGWTALLHAVHRQHPRAIRLLLDRGADPNLPSRDGATPLLMAADSPDSSMVEALLAYGANPRVEGPGGLTPLTQAVSGGALTDIDRPLLGGCRTDTVRLLLAHDPALRLPDTPAGHVSLWWARFHGCAETLELVARQEKA